MTEKAVRRGVVVGVDGSEQAKTAAEWALGYASPRGLPLRVVAGVEWPADLAGFDPYPIQAVHDDTRQILDGVTAHCRQLAPDAVVDGVMVTEPPIPALLAAADTAELLVVGCRGLRPSVAALLGSVSAAVVAHAACPVAVVRSARMPGPDAPVVAGIDGSTRDDATLRYAFEEAERAGAPLVIVHAWSDVPLVTAMGIAIGEIPTWIELRAAAEALVARKAGPWVDKYPRVAVHTRVPQDRPAYTLLELGHTAGLIVVGSHGRGGFLGMLLGSVARHLVQHADCPVLVVREPVATSE